jgi:hypothetical protein
MKLTKGPDIEAHPPLFFELLQGDALYVILICQSRRIRQPQDDSAWSIGIVRL